ncbi:hypothetical protein FGO68_gene10700 [Halteria grandinella]|uniref:Uncharacterized protein n=1 Tax=Halteria grandinella TaxID=5974 RepID=A0A8J8SUZ1_HALGN|nr:hypothetical protein FGO68_gene10700 [Halteria grandinella]
MVPLLVKCHKEGLQISLINCIDINEGKVIKQWLIEVEGRETVTNKVFNVSVIRGGESVHKFLYPNIFEEEITLCLLSSRPNIMQIQGVDEVEGRLKFTAKETKEIEIKISALKKNESVKLYIYDSEHGGNKIHETLDFNFTLL